MLSNQQTNKLPCRHIVQHLDEAVPPYLHCTYPNIRSHFGYGSISIPIKSHRYALNMTYSAVWLCVKLPHLWVTRIPCFTPWHRYPASHLDTDTLLHTLTQIPCFAPWHRYPASHLDTDTLLHTLTQIPCFTPWHRYPASHLGTGSISTPIQLFGSLYSSSSRLCPSTAGCSPPSMSSIVVCLLLS